MNSNNNNLHTSVVIELANQEQPEEQKAFKIDLNESDQPKDYVIDQIFCGENVTVYALFEIPEADGKQSECEVMEIQNSSNIDEYRFIHKNSCKRTVQQKPPKITIKEIEDDLHAVLKHEDQKKSFHSLKHSDESYDIPTKEYSGEVKVLFSNDLMSKDPKSVKHKATSKGVNTEITQSPRLIEEVQRTVTGNFSSWKKDGKSVQSSNCTTRKTSFEAIDTDFQPSFSSIGSDTEKRHRKKSSPDFLFVPLIMMEDKHKFQKDKNQINPEEKASGMEAKTVPTKASFGTNTEAADFSSSMSETEGRSGSKCHSSSQCEGSKGGKAKLQDMTSQFKKKGKETLLSEIRKLQGKLNALIKTIEFNDVYSSNNEDEDYAETETGTSEDIRKRDSTDSFRRNESDNIPIFPPLDFTSLNKSEKEKPNNKIQGFRESIENITSEDLVKSLSSTFLSNDETVQKFSDPKTPKVKLKNVFSQLNINWESRERCRSVGSSKSDTTNRISLPAPKCAKKSFSFVLRDDKTEVFYLKKMKNSPFKFEGSLKANLRIIQNGEFILADNLTPITHEMGDEANGKLRGPELQRFSKSLEKLRITSKNVTMNMNKSLNEEEGDAKLLYPKQFVQHPAVHYCSTSTLVPDGLLKTVKSAKTMRGKSKTRNSDEGSGTKICSDSEKPSTPIKTTKKSSITESDVKKEFKSPKVSSKNKVCAKKEKKVERGETTFAHDGNKRKSISGSRKLSVRGTADSKLHVDKLIKKVAEGDSKSELNKKAEPSTDEKPGLKIDRLPRPRSQRRKLREKTPAATSGQKKEEEKMKSGAAVDMETDSKNSSQDMESKLKRNVGPVMVFESAEEFQHDSEPGENPAWLSSNPSSVVVELFSKKPSSVDELYAEMNDGSLEERNGENEDGSISGKEVSGSTSSKNRNKPIVKSVWALTKVLLYEDGTKKLEVLEASLTPPGYSLNSPDKSSIEDNSK